MDRATYPTECMEKSLPANVGTNQGSERMSSISNQEVLQSLCLMNDDELADVAEFIEALLHSRWDQGGAVPQSGRLRVAAAVKNVRQRKTPKAATVSKPSQRRVAA